MSYPDKFTATAHDAIYAPQADCLVDDWHTADAAVRMAQQGAQFALADDDAGYRAAVSELDDMRDTAFANCRCGRCGDSDNHRLDGEALVDRFMPVALELAA